MAKYMITIAPPKIRWKWPVIHCVLWIGGIELVAHVDQPARAAEAEHHERERDRQHDRIAATAGR